jgi:hypothetical protein
VAALPETKTGLKVEDLQASELYGVLGKSVLEKEDFPDLEIWRKIRVAEDHYERELAMSFRPRRVFCDAFGRLPESRGGTGVFPSSGELAIPDDYDDVKDLEVPAYPYREGMFDYNEYGGQMLSHRPVRNITVVAVAFPGIDPVYMVPRKWCRLDRQSGWLQFVPSSGQAMLAILQSYLFRVVGGGRQIPMSLYVDTVVGFTPEKLQADHQDLLEGVRLMSLLLLGGVITTIAVPGGGTSVSLSIDGQSKSNSFGQYGAYSGKIQLAIQQEALIRQTWAKREKGVPIAIV